MLDADAIDGTILSESSVPETDYCLQLRLRKIDSSLVILAADNMLFTVKLNTDNRLHIAFK